MKDATSRIDISTWACQLRLPTPIHVPIFFSIVSWTWARISSRAFLEPVSYRHSTRTSDRVLRHATKSLCYIHIPWRSVDGLVITFLTNEPYSCRPHDNAAPVGSSFRPTEASLSSNLYPVSMASTRPFLILAVYNFIWHGCGDAKGSWWIMQHSFHR